VARLLEKIKRVLFEEPTCLKENMFDVLNSWLYTLERTGCLFFSDV